MRGAVPVLIIFIKISRGVLHTPCKWLPNWFSYGATGGAYAIRPQHTSF